MAIYLPQLLDYAAVNTQSVIPANQHQRVPRPVLMGIPGMDEETASAIIGAREVGGEPPEQRHETAADRGLVDLETMKRLLPFVCCQGAVFRANVVGYFDGGGPSARVEAIIDATGTSPRLVFWRDISHLGRGYSLATLGIEFDDAQFASAGPE